MTLQTTDETTQLGRPSRRRNPEDTRRRILDAGERAFALRGFAGARLRDMRKRREASRARAPLLRRQARLVREVLERGLGRIELAGVETLGAGRSNESTVRAFIAVLYDFCANNKSLLRIIENAFRDREAASFELAERVIGKRARPLIALVRERIELGQKLGDVRSDVPSHSLVQLTFTSIVYRFTMAEPFAEALSLGQAGHETQRHSARMDPLLTCTLRPKRSLRKPAHGDAELAASTSIF